MAAAARKKSKKVPSFEEFRDDVLLFYTICLIIISSQTIIPSLIVRKTYPGCKRSFSGYPLGEESDISTIRYFACVMRNLSSSIPPWNTLKKLIGRKDKNIQEEKIQKKILTILKKKNITYY